MGNKSLFDIALSRGLIELVVQATKSINVYEV